MGKHDRVHNVCAANFEPRGHTIRQAYMVEVFESIELALAFGDAFCFVCVTTGDNGNMCDTADRKSNFIRNV